MGIGDYATYPSFALGAGETTVERLVNAYSMLANHGRELTPRVIAFVQDRHGKVIWPKNWRPCDGCNKADWDGRPMPRDPKSVVLGKSVQVRINHSGRRRIKKTKR